MSRLISRQIGLLINRQGKVELTIIGTASGIFIPELARERSSSGRLRGLRLLHTHLTDTPLSHEDLMDLLFLRLDSIGILTVDPHGSPINFQSAHLLPQNLNEIPQIEELEFSRAKKFKQHQAKINEETISDLNSENSENKESGLSSEDFKNIINSELYENNIVNNQLKLPKNLDKSPYRISELLPFDQVQNNFEAEIEALEQEFSRVTRNFRPQNLKYDQKEKDSLQAGKRAVMVSVSKIPKSIQELNLLELAELARTAGLEIAGSLIQRVTKVNPRQILSQTKLAELEVIALQAHANIIIFDGELLPAQLQNLTELTERKVLDRTQLILDIFAQHAKTNAGKLQVEMAQLKYTQPRLVGKNRAMDRLMGGIGGRGPGETKLETDRRRIKERIAKIKNDLESLKKQRAANRSQRNRREIPVAALVGYTNAGKSTLLNQLTKSDVLAENKLFATLDPTTRRLKFPKDKEILLADTVGFIRELPKELLEAFRATLEELSEADILIHVVDASHPEMEQQLEAVEIILGELDLNEIPRMLILNKWDMTNKEEQNSLLERFPKSFSICALDGRGLERVSRHLQKILF